jgi:hypothetical protein
MAASASATGSFHYDKNEYLPVIVGLMNGLHKTTTLSLISYKGINSPTFEFFQTKAL